MADTPVKGDQNEALVTKLKLGNEMTVISKLSGTFAAVFSLVAGSAAAQDTIDYDWEGFYGGGFVAGSFFDVELSDLTDTFTNDAPAINELVLAGGINLGYNWIPRNDNLLLGLELEIQGGHETSNLIRFNAAGTDGQLYENRITSMTAVRGRVGMMNDNLLVYLAGGPTWANVEYNSTALDDGIPSESCDVAGIICADSKEQLLGLTVGVGMEYAIRDTTTLRFEIVQISLPTASAEVLNGNTTAVCSTAAADECAGFYSSDVTQIQFGVNFKF